MRSWTTQALLERLVTGDRCEAKGCYELAVWLVSFNDESSHWCSKHTRMQMRNGSIWGAYLDRRSKRDPVEGEAKVGRSNPVGNP
jgi:hypothetical protein